MPFHCIEQTDCGFCLGARKGPTVPQITEVGCKATHMIQSRDAIVVDIHLKTYQNVPALV